jgi:hypothetical protein
LAIAQFVTHAEEVPPFMSANMFLADTVFGVVVTLRNVSVLSVLTDHVPVNVQTRKIFGVYAWSPSMTVLIRLVGEPGENPSTFAMVLFSFSRRLSPIKYRPGSAMITYE